MTDDLRTMFWKEWRSLIGGRARRQVVLTGGMLAIWAFWFPVQMGGRDWVSDPIPMGILGVVMPMVIVGIVVPDAIAGERERHTLSTLLASRLTDRTILYGKLVFAVAIGWLSAPVVLGVAVVVANITAPEAAPLFYDPVVLVGVLVLALLVALLTGAIGIFVSLRAGTAQEAQQMTLLGLMVPMMLAGFGATALFMNREVARDVIDFLGGTEARLLVLAVMVVLAIIDGLLVAAADRRFRRGRLIVRGT
jgi:ABC-2 type transport system permease protein